MASNISDANGDLNIAEARLNTMHRALNRLETSMKMGIPYEDESVAGDFQLLETMAHSLPATYRRVSRNHCPNAETRLPKFSEVASLG